MAGERDHAYRDVAIGRGSGDLHEQRGGSFAEGEPDGTDD
jgi:hypothetical protein